MTTSADIVNRALQLIGGYNNDGPVTGDPPAFDGTAEGIAAGTLYTSVVQTIARQSGWDFSRNAVALTDTTGTPPLGFAKEYYYPSNGIQIRQLIPATITDPNNPLPIRWTVGNVVAGLTAATGTIFFPGNPSPSDEVVLNGSPFLFVTGPSSGNNIHIEATLALTLFNLIVVLQASTDPAVDVAAYTGSGGPIDTLVVTYKTLGTVGNAYTLSANAATPSGPTLTGGTSALRKVIWTNLTSAQGLITNQPAEDLWDALFTESVVRLLASELATALEGKPETAKMTIEQAASFEQMGEKRTDT